jgi:hypothetical protein
MMYKPRCRPPSKPLCTGQPWAPPSAACACSKRRTSWTSRAAEFIATVRQETGSTDSWYGFNVHLSANILREAAAMTTQIDGSIIPSDLPGSLSMAYRVPCGVVVSIAPWNAPVILATRAMAMPLACRQHRHPESLRTVSGHPCSAGTSAQ